jgi:hypothetical protein
MKGFLKFASSVASLFMLRVANYGLLLCTYDNLIVMVFSSTPCNSSNSISGERQILVLLDTHQTLDFRQPERKVRIQAIMVMLHIFASYSGITCKFQICLSNFLFQARSEYPNSFGTLRSLAT